MGINKFNQSLKVRQKMKISLAVTIISAQAARLRRDVEKSLEQEKRYFQLTDMMEHYNPEFDERKYWNYGCNCLNTGDRPMSDPGFGPPVDELDRVCKEYKDCVKCAKIEFGDMCIGEFVKYKMKITNGGVQCRDDANTCGRALCECDHLLARKHNAAKHVFDKEKHYFWATPKPNGDYGWDPKNKHDELCPRMGGSGAPQCCSNAERTVPFFLFNGAANQCCADGSVKPFGEQC